MLVDAKNTTKFNNIKEDYNPGILIIETLVMKKTTVLASFCMLRQETVPNNRTVDNTVRYCALERNQCIIRLKKVALNSLYKATEMEDFVQLTP